MTLIGTRFVVLALIGAAGAVFWVFRHPILSRLLGFALPRLRITSTWERVPMVDGKELATKLTRPRRSIRGEAFPTLLLRTPYGQGRAGGIVGWANDFYAGFFARRGYNVVQQDVRGRFTSEGDFIPFLYERGDGQATLKWIRRQPWFDGRIGTFGHSYGGFVQWAISDDKGLAGIVPIQSSTALPRAMHRDGAVQLDLALRFMHIIDLFGVPGSRRSFYSSMRDNIKQTQAVSTAVAHLPIIEADRILLGRDDPGFRDALDGPDDEDFWRHVTHGVRRDSATAPIFLITGWMDPFLRDTLEDYAALCAAGKKPRLYIGNWTHGQIDKFWLNEVLEWMDGRIRDGKPDPDTQCRYIVLNEEAGGTDDGWHRIDAWPPKSASHPLYLDATSNALSATAPTSAGAKTFTYDPKDPTPSFAGALLDMEACGQKDNRALEARDDVLVFDGPVLTSALTLLGASHATFTFRSTLPSADLFVRICDVHPDGRSLNVVDGFKRIPIDEAPSNNGVIDGEVRVELWPVAYTVPAGHRLRVQVSSGAHPRFARNLGYGEADYRAEKMRAAEQTLRTGPDCTALVELAVRG